LINLLVFTTTDFESSTSVKGNLKNTMEKYLKASPSKFEKGDPPPPRPPLSFTNSAGESFRDLLKKNYNKIGRRGKW
jgi:hypothetical protein